MSYKPDYKYIPPFRWSILIPIFEDLQECGKHFPGIKILKARKP